MMQRVCAAALLRQGVTTIKNPGKSDDDIVALDIIGQLGAKIVHQTDASLTIASEGLNNSTNSINCGESGLSARLFTPIAALSNHEILISGKGSLLSRPMEQFGVILPQLEVALNNFNGHLPFSVKGPLQPRSISLEGSISSQFLTGVLFAFAFSTKKTVTIEVKNLKSRPYIDLTIEVLKQFGKKITHYDYRLFYVYPNEYFQEKEIEVIVEGDWSSAAALLTGAAINGNISIHHLNFASLQADKKIIDILTQAGAEIQLTNLALSIAHHPLNSFETDLTDSPDLFPVTAILAAYSKGTSKLKGLHRLEHKESNRADSIAAMLQQFGVSFHIDDDTLYIEGKEKVQPAIIDSYNDHRIVMAAAIGAMKADGDVVIKNAEAITKSYPDFFKHLSSLGLQCDIKN